MVRLFNEDCFHPFFAAQDKTALHDAAEVSIWIDRYDPGWLRRQEAMGIWYAESAKKKTKTKNDTAAEETSKA